MKILYSVLILATCNTLAVPEAPCKTAYDTCWCATQVSSTQGICLPSVSGQGLICNCTVVQTDDEIKKRQHELFEQAPDALFHNPGGKAQLRQKLQQGTITYYSTEIPIGARLNTDYACSQAPAYSCEAFKNLLTSGKLGTSFLSSNGTLPMQLFNRYNNAISLLCDEIQGGTFMKNNILMGGRQIPQQTLAFMTSPCARFIQILQQYRLMPPAGVKDDAITAREKAAINAICSAPEPAETKRNNDPCVCGDERQPQALKPGLCQVNKYYSTDTLQCHCPE